MQFEIMFRSKGACCVEVEMVYGFHVRAERWFRGFRGDRQTATLQVFQAGIVMVICWVCATSRYEE
jgi:hypothetical protein